MPKNQLLIFRCKFLFLTVVLQNKRLLSAKKRQVSFPRLLYIVEHNEKRYKDRGLICLVPLMHGYCSHTFHNKGDTFFNGIRSVLCIIFSRNPYSTLSLIVFIW